ncbi:MAG: efflux RND transporter periplasmic adaptor subunit [Gemmatimonadota bacterium]
MKQRSRTPSLLPVAGAGSGHRRPRAALALFTVGTLAAGCHSAQAKRPYALVPVQRRNIVVTALASGVVQPDTLVEIKSKASGEIIRMMVDAGQQVDRGSLLVEIDPRTPRNTLKQAQADLDVARARQATIEAEERRARQLLQSQGMSRQEYDSVALALANAKDATITAELSFDNATIGLDNTKVRAPMSGTIVLKGAERGQVIASPTEGVGGGTLLLTMADLTLVEVRVKVDETDLRQIHPGLAATVVVAAYPNRPFQGSVLKVEPQADTAGTVTAFPVLVRVANPANLLKPGMSADVEFHIARQDSVWAIPSAAFQAALTVEPPRAGEAVTTTGVVFVKGTDGPTPVRVRTGVTDLDYTEITGGLSGGDSVVVLPAQIDDRLRRQLRARLDRLTEVPRSPALPGAPSVHGAKDLPPNLREGEKS